MFSNTTGSYNSALGDSANVGANNLTNATAIGAKSFVEASNSLVLGAVSGKNDYNGANTKVGIGTTTPDQALHVKGQVRIDTTLHATDADSILTISSTNVIRKRTAASLAGGGGSGWSLTGNAGTNPATNYIGTSDNIDLHFRVEGITSGLLSKTSRNTALGFQSLQNITTATDNTAIGYNAMQGLTEGSNNTAIGREALVNNLYGSDNVAVGGYTLSTNNFNSNNVAVGSLALQNNEADGNTALGHSALRNNNFGTANTGLGKNALLNNTTGLYNTAVGNGAGTILINGNHNVFVGHNAMAITNSISGSIAIGSEALIGTNATENTTVIGNGAYYNVSNAIRLGNALVTTVEGPVAYTIPSDGRFKTNVSAADVVGLDFITKLRPVNYNFDTKKYQEFLSKELPDSIRRKHLAQDFTKSTALRQTGFIAQEVELAAKAANYDFSGGLHKPQNENDNYSVAYSQFVVPLVKSVQELNAKIATLEKQLATRHSEVPSTKSDVFKGDENPAISAQKKEINLLKTQNSAVNSKLQDLQMQTEELKKMIEQLIATQQKK